MDSLSKTVNMTNRIFIFIISLILSLKIQAQDSTKLSTQYLTAGVVSLTASVLPYHVAHTTYINNQQNQYSYLFVGVWFSFGVVLDVNAIYCFRQSCKYRKKSLYL